MALALVLTTGLTEVGIYSLGRHSTPVAGHAVRKKVPVIHKVVVHKHPQRTPTKGHKTEGNQVKHPASRAPLTAQPPVLSPVLSRPHVEPTPRVTVVVHHPSPRPTPHPSSSPQPKPSPAHHPHPTPTPTCVLVDTPLGCLTHKTLPSALPSL